MSPHSRQKQHSTMSTTRSESTVAVVDRKFHAPWSTDVLRILHGTACIACRTTRGQLYPAGTAVSIGPSGDTIRWDVRQCAKCAEGATR
jgi:hypothetical protein